MLTTCCIVCVHGLGGHPVKTWTSSDRTNWLTDILPSDLREHDVSFRVMTYDYHKESKLSSYFPAFLYQHSRRLMRQLADKRGSEHRDRPLIFIAHSLGGLIVKGALVQSSVSDIEAGSPLKSIQLSTVGVLFFGTPNRDGPKLQWSKLLTRVMLISGSETPSPDVDPLLWQDELFRLELDRYKSIEDKFRNFAFHETKHTSIQGEKESVLAVPRDLTLPVHTSSRWESHPVHRNHEDLCKFDSRSDIDYRAVLQAVRTCLGDVRPSADHTAEPVELYRGDANVINKIGSDGMEEEDADEVSLQMFWRTQSFLSRSVLSNYPVAQSKIIRLEDELDRLVFSLKVFNNAALQTGLELLSLYDESDEPGKSEKLYNRLKNMTKGELDRLEAKYGYRHRKPLRLAADLARLYAVAGHHQKSECLNRGLLVISEDLFGYHSLEQAFILNQLAQNSHAQDDLEQALNLLKRVHVIQSERYKEGRDHPEAVRTSARMAIIHDQQGNFDRAQQIYREVIAFRTYAMGPDHPETLKATENLALSYRLQGRSTLHRAADLYRDVRDHRRTILHKFGPSDLVNPELKPMADEALHLYNETMTRLTEVVRQQNDLEELQKLEDEWSHVKQINTVNPKTSIDRDDKDDEEDSDFDDYDARNKNNARDFNPHHLHAHSHSDDEIRTTPNIAQAQSSTRMAQNSGSSGAASSLEDTTITTNASMAQQQQLHDPLKNNIQGIGDWAQISSSTQKDEQAYSGNTDLAIDDVRSDFSPSHVRKVSFRL